MPTTNQTRIKRSNGDGLATAFAWPNQLREEESLGVYLRVNTTGVQTKQTINTHYTIALVTAGFGSATVNMVTAPASGETLVLVYENAFSNEDSYKAHDGFPAVVVDEDFDRTATKDLTLQASLDGAVKAQITDDFDPTIPPMVGKDNYAITIKDDGDGTFSIELEPSAGLSDAQIKTAYENNADTNEFSDGEQTKLAGIETSATADQTDAEIRTAVEAATDSNVFTDADHTLLGNQSGTNTGDESSATSSAEGIVELATSAEVTTGTDTSRAMTPESLKQSSPTVQALTTVGETTSGGKFHWSRGANIASTSALTTGDDGNYFLVTGTSTINSIAIGGALGTEIILEFNDALTLTHNVTNLILPNGANITTTKGDIARFVHYASGDARLVGYQFATTHAFSGAVSVAGNATFASDVTVTGTIVQESFTAVTYDTNWADLATYQGVEFMKDSMGFVHIRGNAVNTVDTGAVNMFTLPVGYRPPARLLQDTLGNTTHAFLDLQVSGVVRVAGGSYSSNISVNVIFFVG